MQVPIVQYDAKYVPNPNPRGETPFEEFWKVREAVLAACKEFGAAGPDYASKKFDTNVRYWVIDDQYNDDLYQNMEVVEPEGWSSEWMLGLMACLKRHSGWGVSIANTDQGHLLVFADRILVTGPTFANCTDVDSVVRAAKLVDEDLEERKNGPLQRQLTYLKGILPAAMKEARKKTFAYLVTFNGYQLHEGQAVWILQTKKDYELILDTEYAAIRETAVTADGEIHAEYCKDFSPYTDVLPPFWLLTYIIKDRSQTHFRLIDEQKNTVATIAIPRVIGEAEIDQAIGAT